MEVTCQMITVYCCDDREKIRLDVVKTLQEAYKVVSYKVWLKQTSLLNDVYFVHRTSKTDELMIDIRGNKKYYLLKADDDIDKQELKRVADCWRDEWRD